MQFQFKTTPYQHQQTIFDRFKDAEFFALFADMGTGKTKATIDIASYKYVTGQINALLILAPNHVHTQWISEQFPLHCSVAYSPFVWNSNKIGRKIYRKNAGEFVERKDGEKGFKIFAVNIEALQAESIIPFLKAFLQTNKVMVVIDEATKIKNPNAKRSKMVWLMTKYGYRAILTGTPTAKSPFDLWSMFEFLKTNFFGCNYHIFQHRYGVMMKGVNHSTGARYQALIDEDKFKEVKRKLQLKHNEFGATLDEEVISEIAYATGVSEKNIRFIDSQTEYRRYKRLDELKDIIAPHTFSIRKEDCLDLPPKIYEIVYVELSKEQKVIYKNIVNDMLAEYDGHTLTVSQKIALTIRLRQVCGGFFPYSEERLLELPNGEIKSIVKSKTKLIGKDNIKLTRLLEDLEEVSEDTKIIVWATFIAELEMLHEALTNAGYRCCLYYGKTSNSERARMIDEFKSGAYDIFIGNQHTAGFGLNLQNATLQYFFSNDYATEVRLQAEDRSHRPGVKSSVVYKDFIAKGTVDEHILTIIKEGKEVNDYFKQHDFAEIIQLKEENDNERY